MKKLLFIIPLLFAPSAWAACPSPLVVQDGNTVLQNFHSQPDASGNCDPITVPVITADTDASSTVTVTNTFQTVFAANATRRGCLIQNNGTHVMYVHTTTASATLTNSEQVAPGLEFTCATGTGGVYGDIIKITGTATDAFVAKEQN